MPKGLLDDVSEMAMDLFKEQKQKRFRISFWEYHVTPSQGTQWTCPFRKGDDYLFLSIPLI